MFALGAGGKVGGNRSGAVERALEACGPKARSQRLLRYRPAHRFAGKLDIDLEQGDVFAALDLHLHLVDIDGDMLRHHGEHLLPQDRNEIGLTARGALMRQQDL